MQGTQDEEEGSGGRARLFKAGARGRRGGGVQGLALDGSIRRLDGRAAGQPGRRVDGEARWRGPMARLTLSRSCPRSMAAALRRAQRGARIGLARTHVGSGAADGAEMMSGRSGARARLSACARGDDGALGGGGGAAATQGTKGKGPGTAGESKEGGRLKRGGGC